MPRRPKTAPVPVEWTFRNLDAPLSDGALEALADLLLDFHEAECAKLAESNPETPVVGVRLAG